MKVHRLTESQALAKIEAESEEKERNLKNNFTGLILGVYVTVLTILYLLGAYSWIIVSRTPRDLPCEPESLAVGSAVVAAPLIDGLPNGLLPLQRLTDLGEKRQLPVCVLEDKILILDHGPRLPSLYDGQFCSG